jgi:hypothetical protein
MVSRVNKVGGQQPGGLCMQEGPPPGVCSAWGGAEAGGGENPADRTRAQVVSEPDEFAVDAGVDPGRILLRQAHDKVTDLVTNRWAAGPVGVSPLLRDQSAVPGPATCRGNKAVQTQLRWEQAGQGEQDRSVRPGGSRSADLTTQHPHFVAQDQGLDVLAAVLRVSNPSQPNTVTEIRYSTRNSTARDHGLTMGVKETAGHRIGDEFWHGTGFNRLLWDDAKYLEHVAMCVEVLRELADGQEITRDFGRTRDFIDQYLRRLLSHF